MALADFVLCLPEADIPAFCVRFFERLDLCRQNSCLNCCWVYDDVGNFVRIVTAEPQSYKIEFNTEDRANTARCWVRNGQADHYRSLPKLRPLPANPVHDSIVFESLYEFMHQTIAGFCQVKHGKSTAPLSRLDLLEERVDAVCNAISLDAKKNENPAKRQKIDATN